MTADPKPTKADLELLARIAPLLGTTLGKAMAPALEQLMAKHTAAIERRLVEAEAQLVSLRRELSSRPAPDTSARGFVSLGPDPDRPGNTLVQLDDGGILSALDERLTDGRPAGRA
jgi:hypothetical protein